MTVEMRLGRVRAVWTDRHGGVSRAPYDTANLAAGRDAPDAVTENRRRVAARLALPDPAEWWWLRQVHGTDVVAVGTGAVPSEPPAADAAVTTTIGVPLVVLTADCAPLVLASDDCAAVVHAGWGGLLAGVIDRAVAALRDGGTGRQALVAVLE